MTNHRRIRRHRRHLKQQQEPRRLAYLTLLAARQRAARTKTYWQYLEAKAAATDAALDAEALGYPILP